MSRLIDADVFKENMDYICDAGGWLEPVTKAVREFVKKHIDAQTTVNPEPHWIPCSERMPSDEDYDETFTVTIQCEHYDGWDDYVTGYADWTPHGWDIQSYYMGQIKVIAWMPLPEPYGGDNE